jgi:hypothetical protein
MCNPAVAIMAAGGAIQAGSAIAGHVAQNKAAANNRKMADEAAANDLAALSTREMQERTASVSNILSIERQVQQERASAAVMAGEAGVSGASVTALLSLIETRGGQAVSDVNTQFGYTKDQIAREAQSVGTNRKGRIAAVPKASWLQTGARLAGAGLDLYTGIKGNRPIKGGG